MPEMTSFTALATPFPPCLAVYKDSRGSDQPSRYSLSLPLMVGCSMSLRRRSVTAHCFDGTTTDASIAVISLQGTS